MWILFGLALVVLAVIAYDLVQREHAILRNFPASDIFDTFSRLSVRSSGNTSSRATTRRSPSVVTSADGSTRRRRSRTTISASGPITISKPRPTI